MEENITNTSLNNAEEEEIFSNFTVWIVGFYYCVLIFAACANFFLIISLLFQKKQGTTYLILQFCAVDFISTWIAAVEVSSLLNLNWTLNSDICQLFLGTETLVNAIIVYLHVLLNLHSISTWNIQNKTISIKNPLTSDESNECLVWSETLTIPNRSLNIDYKHKKTSVSIIVPCILIWFCCLSLCIPEFTLSTTVVYNENKTLCTIVDAHYSKLFQYLMVFFRDLLPTLLLVITFFIVLFKMCNKNSLSNVKKNNSAKKFKELKNLLLLSVILSFIYTVSSFQRSLFQFLHIISQNVVDSTLERFKMPPLDNFIISHYINIYLSMFHYSALIVRPAIFIIIMPCIIDAVKKCLFKNKINK